MANSRFEVLLRLVQGKEQEVLELLGEVTRQLKQDEDKAEELKAYREEYLNNQAALGTKSSGLLKQSDHFINQLGFAIEHQHQSIHLHLERRRQVLELYSTLRGKRLLFEKLVAREQDEKLMAEEKRIQQTINDVASRLILLKNKKNQ